MPLDPSIILGGKPVTLENPLTQYGNMLAIQNAQQEYQKNALAMQDQAASSAAMRAYGASDQGEGAQKSLMMASPQAGMAVQKAGVDLARTKAQTGRDLSATAKDTQAMEINAVGQQRDKLGDIDMSNPDAMRAGFARWTAEGFDNPQLASVFAKGGTREQKLAEIAAMTPEQLESTIARSALGAVSYYTKRTRTADSEATQATSVANNTANNARMVSEGALNRNQSERASLRADARMRANDAAGPGTDRPLSRAAFTQITEARDNAATIDRLKTSFKPEYAEKGVLGVGSELSMKAKGVLGTDKDSVEWWKNYRKQAELIERHALFGATLTGNELSAWRSADIDPGMDSAVIERNLATRAMIAKKVFDNKQQDLIDAGSSEGRIRAIGGRNTDVSDSPNAPSGKSGGLTAAEQAELAQLRKQLGR